MHKARTHGSGAVLHFYATLNGTLCIQYTEGGNCQMGSRWEDRWGVLEALRMSADRPREFKLQPVTTFCSEPLRSGTQQLHNTETDILWSVGSLGKAGNSPTGPWTHRFDSFSLFADVTCCRLESVSTHSTPPPCRTLLCLSRQLDLLLGGTSDFSVSLSVIYEDRWLTLTPQFLFLFKTVVLYFIMLRSSCPVHYM